MDNDKELVITRAKLFTILGVLLLLIALVVPNVVIIAIGGE